jgi:hypothetical protein
VAPEDGTYVVDLAGSGPNVSFGLHREHCRGELLAEGPEGSRVARVSLARGAELFITLHGKGGFRSMGPQFQLHIDTWRQNETETCADRTDNDADGLADCSDPDCARQAECTEGQACANVDLWSSLPAHFNWSDTPYYGPDFFAPRCYRDPGRPERVYRWTAPADGTYVFEPNAVGATVALYSSCTGVELACDGQPEPDYGPPSSWPVVSRSFSAGETVLIVIEGTYWDGNPLALPLGISVHQQSAEDTAGLCADGLDNDADGAPDFFDSGCPNYRD